MAERDSQAAVSLLLKLPPQVSIEPAVRVHDLGHFEDNEEGIAEQFRRVETFVAYLKARLERGEQTEVGTTRLEHVIQKLQGEFRTRQDGHWPRVPKFDARGGKKEALTLQRNRLHKRARALLAKLGAEH